MCLWKLLYIVMFCEENLYFGIEKILGGATHQASSKRTVIHIVDKICRKTNRRRSSSQTNGFEHLSWVG